MNDFSQTIRNIFKGNNYLHKLLFINVSLFLIFGLLSLIEASAESIPFSFFVKTLIKNLSLPASFSDFIYQPWSLFTHFFVESASGIFHFIFSMLWLYWMGGLLQEYLGTKKLLKIYLWAGLVGGLMFLLAFNLIPGFTNIARYNTVLMGSSGAVLAIIAAIATLIPSYELRLFLFGSVKLKWLALIIIAIDLISESNNAGVLTAHLGSAIFGYLYIYNLKNKTYVGEFFDAISNYFKSIFSSKKKTKITIKKSTVIYYKSDTEEDEPNQEIVDEILDKISQSGYGSLSEKEKNILFKASKQL